MKHKGTLNSHWGIWICLFSSLFFLFCITAYFPQPRSTYTLSIHHIFLLLLHTAGDTGLKSVPALIAYFTMLPICGPRLVSPSNSIWYCFNCIPLKNKRRISFETLKLSSSYLNDSFSVLRSTSSTHTHTYSSQQGNGILLNAVDRPSSFVTVGRH